MSFRSKVSSALVGASLVFAGTNVAQAAPLLSITNTVGQTLGNPPFTLGFEFTATSTFWATDLGFFDSSADGLAEAHAIGLWDNSGTLLASTVLPSGMAGTLVSGFRYVPIAPVLLTPGSYRVGALFSSGADPVVFNGFATGFATLSDITFVANRWQAGAVLSFPAGSYGDEPSFFGPNVNLTEVPEPLTLMLVGSGLATTLVRRRRV